MKTAYLLAIATLLSTSAIRAAYAVPTDQGSGAVGCVDFSGSYEGTCTTNGVAAPDAMQVSQNRCETVQLGEREVVVGQATSSTETANGVTTQTIISVNWNGAQSELLGKIDVIRSHGDSNQREWTQLETAVKLEGGKLVITAQAEHARSVRSNSNEKIDVRCEYVRR